MNTVVSTQRRVSSTSHISLLLPSTQTSALPTQDHSHERWDQQWPTSLTAHTYTSLFQETKKFSSSSSSIKTNFWENKYITQSILDEHPNVFSLAFSTVYEKKIKDCKQII